MLRKYKERLKKSALLKDNMMLFGGIFFLGVAGFLYHFIVGRFLGPAEYGNVGVLLSIIYIFLIVVNTIQMSIAKYTAQFMTKQQEGKIKYVLKRCVRDLAGVAVIVSIIFVLVNRWIAEYLHLRPSLLYTLALLMPCVFLVPIVRGVLQGRGQFAALSANNALEGMIKLIFGPLLMVIGLRTEGAVAAILIAMGVAFLIGFFPLRRLRAVEAEVFPVRQVYKYGLMLGVMLASLTLFYTADVIIVKHFFDEVQAGYYAALAILGKVLFFGSSSIGQVMFPKVVALYSEKKPHKHVLYKSASLVLLFVLPVLFVYFAFPGLVVNILFGSEYEEIIPLLGLFGIYMAVFCFIYLFAYYFISLKSSWKFIGLLVFFNIMEIYLLYQFHETLSQVIVVLIALSLIFLIMLYGLFARMKDA